MASKTLSLLFSLLFFIISADGRSLQKRYGVESVDLSHAFSSLQSTTYTGKTNISDALGLVALITQFPSLEEANDDPCLPPRWTWIECNSDARPRILALNLGNQLLTGVLPDFSMMDALQRIDLSVNLLYGSIPSFLGRFPDLQELNLRSNLFSGLVPDSLACNKDLDLTVDANTGLYVSDKCAKLWNNNPSPSADVNPGTSVPVPTTRSSRSTKKKSSMPVILGTTIPLFALFWIAFGVFAMFRHKAKTAAAVAEANKQGASNSKDNIPAEERPMNERPNNMSP